MGRATTPLLPLAAPGGEAKGGYTMVAVPPAAQIPITEGVALVRLPQHTAYPPGMGQGALGMEVMDRVAKGLAQGGRAQQIART